MWTLFIWMAETESLKKIKADTSGVYEITPHSVTTLVFDDEE